MEEEEGFLSYHLLFSPKLPSLAWLLPGSMAFPSQSLPPWPLTSCLLAGEPSLRAAHDTFNVFCLNHDLAAWKSDTEGVDIYSLSCMFLDHIEKCKRAIGVGCRWPRSAVRCLSVSEATSNNYAENSGVQRKPPSWCFSNCGSQASSMDRICRHIRMLILSAARCRGRRNLLSASLRPRLQVMPAASSLGAALEPLSCQSQLRR